MGEIVQFTRPDGKTCPGYLPTPKAGSGAHGSVCIQEYWGLNDEFKKIKIPLICHFANKDGWITPAKVNDFEAALKQSKSQFEIYRYDAQHAFMNEARPGVYDATSAKLAWDRTLNFLKKTLA